MSCGEDLVIKFPNRAALVAAARMDRRAQPRQPRGWVDSEEAAKIGGAPALSAVLKTIQMRSREIGERPGVLDELRRMWSAVPRRSAASLLELQSWLRSEGDALEMACRQSLRDVALQCETSRLISVDLCSRALSLVRRRDESVSSACALCFESLQKILKAYEDNLRTGTRAIDDTCARLCSEHGARAEERTRAQIRDMKRPSAPSYLRDVLECLPPDAAQWPRYLDAICERIGGATVRRDVRAFREYSAAQATLESEVSAARRETTARLKRAAEQEIASLRRRLREALFEAIDTDATQIRRAYESSIELETSGEALAAAARAEGRRIRGLILAACARSDDGTLDQSAADLIDRARAFADSCQQTCESAAVCMHSAQRCLLFAR